MKVLVIVMTLFLFCATASAVNPYAEQVNVDSSQFSGALSGSGDDAQSVFNHIDQNMETATPNRLVEIFKVLGSTPSKGDLVEIRNDGKLEVCSSRKSDKVIGVVLSNAPGNKKYKIVISGIVKCNVKGHINPGDKLVSSHYDGYARRATRWGKNPIIGVALQESSGYTDKIKILVDKE